MTTPSLFIMAVGLLFTLPLTAASVLSSFETDEAVSAWRWASRGQSQLERSDRFATEGTSSLRFRSPAWKAGMPEWPSFEFHPSWTNWTSYDRLVVDITNPAEERFHFALFVSDGKVPFRQGLSYRFELPSRGYQRFVVPLSSFPQEVNRADIAILHLFTERPATDLDLHIDNLVLLKPGESAAEPGGPFVPQLASLAADAVAGGEAMLAQAAVRVGFWNLNEALQERARAHFMPLQDQLGRWRRELSKPDLTLAQLSAIQEALENLPGQAERVLSVIALQKGCDDAGLPSDNLLVGWATSMEKILPRAVAFELQATRQIDLSLARSEKESFQLAVLPVSAPLKNVRVKAGDLKRPDGAVFSQDHIQCEVVGYVETKAVPPYKTPHVGWWPDPILNFLGPIDIAAGDLQAFWIRVCAPRDQSPGVYDGTLTVSAEAVPPVVLKLRVRVYGFALPRHSPLPLAITFAPHDHPTDQTRQAQSEWRQAQDYPIHAWQKHKLRWAEFLADYYIDYDSLYRHGPPDFEVIRHLRDRGQLVAFNLGNFDGITREPAAASNAWSGLRLAYEQAKALDVLDHAYLYGFDECRPELFSTLEQCARALRREFPEVLLMTTSYDHSYGLDTEVKTIDAWCPLTPSFKPDQAARTRAEGRHVWWYICCGPHSPHANMFIEYPAIEGRLLMGAMTARERPDGFLYYQISIWNSRHPITSGPFTDWDPRSWTSYHGDGSWTCVGPDGIPLPTVRLENFRDGLEDYAYALILEEVVRQVASCDRNLSPSQKQWLEEATTALAVPESLVKSMTEFSREPAALYAWRHHLADLIERSGVTSANPWGSRFGVSGLRAPHHAQP